MIEKQLTSLIFGSVVLESSLTGCTLRVYAEDMRSYSTRTDPAVELKAPLDELRGSVSAPRAREISELIFRNVQSILDEEYPGGSRAAADRLTAWLAAG